MTCACAQPGCKQCDPNGWMKERRMQVGKIDFHETNLPGSFKPLEQFPPTPAMMTMFAPSLRDRMAMAAIQGLLATEAQLDTPLGEEADSLAAAAYEYADAMLKAREQ